MEISNFLYVLETDDFAKKYRPIFLFSNEVPAAVEENRIYIIHSAKREESSRGPVYGHFMTVDTIKTGKMSHCKKAVFFDSYGRSMKHLALIKKMQKTGFNVEFNHKRYQWNNQNCAYFSIYFLLLRSRKHSLKTISKGKFGCTKHSWNAIRPMIENLLPKL